MSNPTSTESTALNTTLEPTANEAATEHIAAPTETSATPTPETETHEASETTETQQPAQGVAIAAGASDEPEYSDEDFARALENFDREQAAETATATSLTTEEAIITGTVVKITDKHVVIDIGLKSEGLIPLDQVVDHTGAPKFNVGDQVEVVVEREEAEGGYLVSMRRRCAIRCGTSWKKPPIPRSRSRAWC
jgi:small subunit ribosomal protein S1